MSVNDITGDKVASKRNSDEFRSGYDAIWGGKEKQAMRYESDYLAKSRAVIAEWWDDMPVMWSKLDELETEYKGNE